MTWQLVTLIALGALPWLLAALDTDPVRMRLRIARNRRNVRRMRAHHAARVAAQHAATRR